MELRKVLGQQDRGVDTPPGRVTVGVYLAGWLQSKQITLGESAQSSYDLAVRRLTAYLGHRRLAILKPFEIGACYGKLRSERRLSSGTIRLTHAILHKALKDAVRTEILARNPADLVTVPKLERHEMQTLSREHVDCLFASAEAANDPWLTLWKLLVTRGLRVGEALALKWSDVDQQARRLMVRRTIVVRRIDRTVLIQGYPKTRSSNRTILMPDVALAALTSHRKSQAELRLRLGKAWQDLIFPDEFGNPQAHWHVNHALDSALQRAAAVWRTAGRENQFPRVRVHDLRHTCATLLFEAGANPREVQELLGHANVTTTLQLYGHVTPRMHQRTATIMDELFDTSGAAQAHQANA